MFGKEHGKEQNAFIHRQYDHLYREYIEIFKTLQLMTGLTRLNDTR